MKDYGLTGKALISDIDAYRGKAGEFAYWWLGQLSYVLKFRDTAVFIDLFLDNYAGRLVPPFFEPGEVVNAGLIMGTHDHLDHIDRKIWAQLASASPSAQFVVPEILIRKLSRDLNIPSGRFIGLDDLSSIETGGVKITGIAAAHEALDRDPETGCFPYLGYVLQAGDCTVYHSGDTHVYEGLTAKLKQWKFDLLLLPINGGDNLSYRDAGEIAGALQPALATPGHYDMFRNYSEDPNLFLDYMRENYPGVKVRLNEYGKRYVIKAGKKQISS